MADSESGYQVGPGRPPLHTRFQKGQSGNPGGRRTKSLPALLADALNETVVMTIDGRRRELTKREAIVAQMVDKSASAGLRATKMLIDMMKDVDHKAGDAAPPPEPRRAGRAGQGGGAALRGAVAVPDPAGDQEGIVVAVAEGGIRGEVREYGRIANTAGALDLISCSRTTSRRSKPPRLGAIG
jgi:hypothetical protein